MGKPTTGYEIKPETKEQVKTNEEIIVRMKALIRTIETANTEIKDLLYLLEFNLKNI